ncbi:hypothetical protein VI817_009310 [Penicillium citrinum]|nr:hypothetical protein VI817_009310 [Penicillium citrinum]
MYVLRHGIRRSGGFIFLVIFSLIRILGACSQLSTIHHHSIGIYIVVAILDSIGLSPLLLGLVGMISRTNKLMVHSVIPRSGFTCFRVIICLAAVLTVTGITGEMSAETFRSPNIQVKTAMILYFASWVMICIGLVKLVLNRGRIAEGEYRNLFAVAISVPFVLIRIVYALLIWFEANNKFNGLDWKGGVRLVMSVFEEIIVVFVCLIFGLGLRVRERNWEVIPDETGAGEMLSGH